MYDIHYIYISLLSSFGFLAIDYYFPPQKNSNINYISLLNAVVTGIPSMLILRQDNIIEYLSSTNPMEVELIYKIPPLIVYGYSFYDFKYAIQEHKLDFLIHSLMIFVFITIGICFNSVHVASIVAIQEMSSIFLNIRYNNFTNILFVTSFTYYRIYLFPKLCIQYILTTPHNYFVYFFTILGMIVNNSLNFFWYMIIFKRTCREIKEKLINPIYGML